MKSIFINVVLVSICACTASRKSGQEYYYVEPLKEQEIILHLGTDSVLTFQDLTGCNQFDFTGRYRRISDSAISYLIFDAVKLNNKPTKSDSNFIFSIKSGDTAWIINGERIFIHNEPFKLTTKSNLNLGEIRYKKLEQFYVNLLGQKGFIKVFGNGKGKKEAKRRLLDCQLPDINIKQMRE